MPVKNLKTYFKKAQREKWAIGQFNFSNLEILQAIIRAAGNLKSPVIIGTSESESKFIGLAQAVALFETFRKESRLSLFLNLDHGKSFDYIEKAIKAGYNAIHFDGSSLPLSQNIKTARKVVALARKENVLVEGEVGVIGGRLTDPEEASKFVRETKVDSLAVNVGTFHGIKKKGKSPKIDFQRLKEIKSKIGNIPLVLHGGSGVPDFEIKKAIKMGVVKININTELRNAFAQSLKKTLRKKTEGSKPYQYLPQTIKVVEKIVEEKIKLFSSINKR